MKLHLQKYCQVQWYFNLGGLDYNSVVEGQFPGLILVNYPHYCNSHNFWFALLLQTCSSCSMERGTTTMLYTQILIKYVIMNWVNMCLKSQAFNRAWPASYNQTNFNYSQPYLWSFWSSLKKTFIGSFIGTPFMLKTALALFITSLGNKM